MTCSKGGNREVVLGLAIGLSCTASEWVQLQVLSLSGGLRNQYGTSSGCRFTGSA
jgi:hypothetical protein